MGRHLTWGALLLLMAGCASTGTRDVQTALLDVHYLEGVETPQARRLAGISDEEGLPADSAMREALIAGDERFWVTATLFRRGDHYTLDMILLNRDDEAVRVVREDVRLVDATGRWLEPVDDWPGAESVGLRGRSRRDAPRFVYDTPTARGTSFRSMSYDPGRSGGAKGSGGTGSVPASMDYTPPVEWRGGIEEVALLAVDHVDVGPQEGRAFWAYWSAEEVRFPLTAFVMLEDRHVVFRFEP